MITKYAIMRPNGHVLLQTTLGEDAEAAKAKMEKWTCFPWSHSRLRGYKLVKLAIEVVEEEPDL